MTTVRSIALETHHEDTGRVRIICSFCQCLIFQHHGDLDQQEGLTLIQQIREHTCYQPHPQQFKARPT